LRPSCPAETTKTITIVVNGDSKKEAVETFYLALFGLSSNALFTKSRSIGTILNDDCVPRGQSGSAGPYWNGSIIAPR